MSNISSKKFSNLDHKQVLQKAAGDDGMLGVNGFANSKKGAKVNRTVVQATPAIDDYRFLDIVSTNSGTSTNGSAIVTIASTVDAVVGQYVYSDVIAAIPNNTTILSVDSPTQITLSANAAFTGTSNIKFANLLRRLRISYDTSTRDNVDDVEALD